MPPETAQLASNGLLDGWEGSKSKDNNPIPPCLALSSAIGPTPCYPAAMTAPAPTWPSYAELRARQLAEHRARAVAAARAAAEAAAREGARVTVFGSLAEGRFHRDSDLDLA